MFTSHLHLCLHFALPGIPISPAPPFCPGGPIWPGSPGTPESPFLPETQWSNTKTFTWKYKYLHWGGWNAFGSPFGVFHSGYFCDWLIRTPGWPGKPGSPFFPGVPGSPGSPRKPFCPVIPGFPDEADVVQLYCIALYFLVHESETWMSFAVSWFHTWISKVSLLSFHVLHVNFTHVPWRPL